MRGKVLPIVIVVAAIFIPADVLAYDERWGQLYKWKSTQDNTIPVAIVRDSTVNPSHVSAVEDAVYSKEVKKSGRPLFSGWNEGIRETSKAFDVKIPTLEIKHTLDTSESITIYLTGKESKEGFDGYTNLFYNEKREIAKAVVTIYDADKLNKKEMESIVRHELGHSLGLSHTTVENDLMRATIDINNNAISLLDLVALAYMY